MLIEVLCRECADAEGNIPVYSAHIQEGGFHRVRCPVEHEIRVQVSYHPVEVLFQSAVDAFADGYYREAFTAFKASHERMLEFSIRVQLLGRNVEQQRIDDVWNEVAAQSERQLGAYVALQAQNSDDVPALLKRTAVELRNKVVHKGYFPSAAETLQFGEHVYELLAGEIARLIANFEQYVSDEINRAVWSRAEKPYVLTSWGSGSFSLWGNNKSTLVEMIEQARFDVIKKRTRPIASPAAE